MITVYAYEDGSVSMGDKPTLARIGYKLHVGVDGEVHFHGVYLSLREVVWQQRSDLRSPWYVRRMWSFFASVLPKTVSLPHDFTVVDEPELPDDVLQLAIAHVHASVAYLDNKTHLATGARPRSIHDQGD